MEGGKKTEEEKWCWLHKEEAGSDDSPCSCSQTPTLFLLECVCVYFLCIDLVSYFHVKKEEPVLFNCNADVLILMNICTNI